MASIPRLHAHPNGRFYWKPEAKLRPDWKSVPLGAGVDAARAEARRLNREAEAWLAKGPKVRAAVPRVRLGPKTVGQVIGLYMASSDWRALAKTTQAQYRYEYKRLEDEFGHDVAGTLDEVRVDDWADELRETAPETLRHVGARGRTLYEWAARKKHVPRGYNPFRGVKLGGGGKRTFRFKWKDVLHLLAVSAEEGRPSIGLALLVTFATVQRISDVLEFEDTIVIAPEHDAAPLLVLAGQPPEASTDAKGARLRFVQSKTGRDIDMGLPAIVAQALNRYPPAPLRVAKPGQPRAWIVCEETGRRWLPRSAAQAFARIRVAAIAKDPRKWKHLAEGQLRDGRRSGFVHRIENGASIPQVCAISGHSLNEGYAIVEHYLPRTPELADQAGAFLKVAL